MKILLTLMLLIVSSSANAEVLINSQVVRNQPGTGTTFVSSGFPFPPGLVTEPIITEGKIRVVVNSSEVAANVTGLRGRHSDGTLRSALIQFTVPNMAQNDVIDAQVIVDGGARSNTDPAYQRPTLAIVQNNNVILPADPEYLTATQITFQRLLPVGDGSEAEERQYTSLAEDRFDWLVSSGTDGTARYEEARGMITFWARSGDKKYFNKAVSTTLAWLDYSTPGSAATPACRADSIVNPDGRIVTSNTTCGASAEWQFARVYSYATMYLLTGYRDFWSVVAYNAQLQQSSVTSQSVANTEIIKNGAYDLPRYNYASRYGGLLAAAMIDATLPVSGQYITGRSFNWSDQLSWTLNALDTTKWDLQWIPFNSGSGTVPASGTTVTQGSVAATILGVYALKKGDPQTFSGSAMPSSGYLQVNAVSGGSFSAGALTIPGVTASATGSEESDYRQGMSGTRSNSPRDANLSGDTVIPSFQLVFPTNFLIDYYLLVEADSRIPLLVKKNLDILLQQIRPMAEGDTYYNTGGGTWGDPLYGKPYSLRDPVDTGDATPYELPEYARFLAFAIKTVGNDTVNGASYSTWYNRVIDTANNTPMNVLIWQWKLFGQFYGFGADAPWLMAQSSLPAPVYREPALHSSIPGDAPDLSRPLSLRLFRNVRIGEVEP